MLEQAVFKHVEERGWIPAGGATAPSFRFDERLYQTIPGARH
jgi:hypothetical protein